ncbi:hypothetical protein C0J52_12699 [Blattella germanica]|nr:hypothetical protein C0J52_12699 [Blattella germanica]
MKTRKSNSIEIRIKPKIQVYQKLHLISQLVSGISQEIGGDGWRAEVRCTVTDPNSIRHFAVVQGSQGEHSPRDGVANLVPTSSNRMLGNTGQPLSSSSSLEESEIQSVLILKPTYMFISKINKSLSGRGNGWVYQMAVAIEVDLLCTKRITKLNIPNLKGNMPLKHLVPATSCYSQDATPGQNIHESPNGPSNEPAAEAVASKSGNTDLQVEAGPSSSTLEITPWQISPVPKITKRPGTRGRKEDYSAVLTSSPYKRSLEASSTAKIVPERKKQRPQKQRNVESSDSEDDVFSVKDDSSTLSSVPYISVPSKEDADCLFCSGKYSDDKSGEEWEYA